jgi:acyl carrier protein
MTNGTPREPGPPLNPEIAARVLALVAQAAGRPLAEITLDGTFADLGIDSLSALSLIGDLEEAFAVSLPNEEVLRIQTVRQAIEGLQRHLSGSGA